MPAGHKKTPQLPLLTPFNMAPFLAECKADVYLPFAQWLLSQDRFDDARVAYKDAGRPDLSSRMLEQLTHNAVVEKRFGDAAFYFYQLSIEALAVSAERHLRMLIASSNARSSVELP
jgi:hypothetical protein